MYVEVFVILKLCICREISRGKTQAANQSRESDVGDEVEDFFHYYCLYNIIKKNNKVNFANSFLL